MQRGVFRAANYGVGLLLCASAAVGESGALVRIWDIGQGVIAIPELVDEQALPNFAAVRPTIDLSVENGGFGELKDNFLTQVDAVLTIDAAGDYGFRLISDDGSRLWVDQRLVIDHDGSRGSDPPGDGSAQLGAGEHALRIRHFEAGGGEQLTLHWKPPGAADYAPIPPEKLRPPGGTPLDVAAGVKAVLTPLRRGLPGDGRPVVGVHPSFKLQPANDSPREPASLEGFAFSDLQVFARPDLPWTQSMVWLSPEQWGAASVSVLPVSPPSEAEGQLLVAAYGTPGIQRLFVEPVGDGYQGCVFRFSDGLAGSVQELRMSADRWVFARIPDAPGGPIEQALQFDPSDNAFEIEAIKARSNGFLLEFSRPLAEGLGWDPHDYYVEQWPFDLKAGKGPRRDGVRYPVKSASVSEERTSVFLEIENLKPSHLVYFRLLPPMYSTEQDRPWSTEAWYTLHRLPKEPAGEPLPRPASEAQNVLSAAEQAAGWRLLFDGQGMTGWHRYRQPGEPPKGWEVIDGCLVRTGPGGDIATDEQFEDFELQLEWRISAGGNSGIFFHVDEGQGWAWETGPEMQVLDNAEHHDGKNTKTSAGANYALHAATKDVTRPVGYFNQARILVHDGRVEHWLNGEKVVEYELGSDDWQKLVAGSKFAGMPRYGRAGQGAIVLQDHGDPVWYRNVKVRKLPAE